MQILVFKKEIEESIVDGYKRLLGPSIEREVRSKLTEEAESHARNVFAKKLRSSFASTSITG